jgi:NitT/TauT family transport system permease protein
LTTTTAPTRNRNPRNGRGLPLIIYACSIAIFFVAWYAISARFAMPILFPGPGRTFAALVQLVEDGSLAEDIAASLARILAGFALGSILGLILGLLMGASRLIRFAVDPYVNFLRFISGIAWIPLATMWLGLGESSKIAVVAYVTVFAVAINTLAGYGAIPLARIRAARALGAGRRQLFFMVELPSCIHFALQGMRLAMAGAFLTVVAAEMIAATSGLGFLISSSRQFMATDTMFVGILTLGALGFAVDKAFLLVSWLTLGKYRLAR